MTYKEKRMLNLLKKVQRAIIERDILDDLRCDDRKVARKYPIVLSDIFMLEIHDTIEEMEQ